MPESKDTPAALLSRGTTSRQARLVSTLEKLPEELHAHPLMTPAIIVIGEVCALADQFEWYEKLPLSGKKIIVTRPRERQEELSQRLRQPGCGSAGTATIPLHHIGRGNCRSRELPGGAGELSVSRIYITFRSRLLFCTAAGKKMDIRRFCAGKIAVIGAGTAQPSAELRTDGRSDAGDL